MKIVVCIKQTAAGELNPFDASAYEAALQLPNAEVFLLSMGPAKTADFLQFLTRLGAKEAYHLCDRAFAGADTLATAYALSRAIDRLNPDYIFCGRQTVDGDTGQVGPELALLCKYHFLPAVMQLSKNGAQLQAVTRTSPSVPVLPRSLCTFERGYYLRKPSIISTVRPVIPLTAADIQADALRCGLSGSKTKVLKTFENQNDRRHCKFIQPTELWPVLQNELKQVKTPVLAPKNATTAFMDSVWCMGEAPLAMAKTVCSNPQVIPPAPLTEMLNRIRAEKPQAILWGSDQQSKQLAAAVAASLQLGLCADCTKLETDGQQLFMYRPAFSGNIVAKIKSTTQPQMATVRTTVQTETELIFGVGSGVKNSLAQIQSLAEKFGAGIAASRAVVDAGILPYEYQVGLTGKTVNPRVYLALGISGAIHHIVGIRQSGTVIAVNPDRKAPVFNYADYGIVTDFETIIALLK